MVALNFPTPTAVGQIYTAGVSSWQWDGTAWNIVPLITPPIADDDAPANPYAGQLWWNALNGNLYVWYVDANSAQWVQTAGNTGAPYKTAETRNRIVNGALLISQENGDAAQSTSGAHLADQWTMNSTVGVAGVRQSTTVIPQMYMQNTVGKPSLAAGDLFYFSQRVEGNSIRDFGWGAAQALPAVLRFDIYTSSVGTYCASIRNVPVDRSFVAAFTVPTAGVWQTVVIPVPANTDGTWLTTNTAGMNVDITFACGSAFIAPATGWNSSGNYLGLSGMTNGIAAAPSTYYVRKIGLYLDPDNTGRAPPFQIPEYGDELLRCQRYYFKRLATLIGYGPAGGAVGQYTSWPVTMRGPPAMSATGGTYTNASASNYVPVDALGGRHYMVATTASTAFWDNFTEVGNARM